jgi:hypothetical protein
MNLNRAISHNEYLKDHILNKTLRKQKFLVKYVDKKCIR